MTITLENLEDFKKLYDEAIKSDSKYFEYEGQLVLTHYAKYVIEYLTNQKK
jgi:hypothetical protein